MKLYFADKAINYIYKGYRAYSTPSMGFLLSSILSSTNQGIRTLTIIATGQLIEGASETLYDADKYPLYIIFKKESNSWKIDLFE